MFAALLTVFALAAPPDFTVVVGEGFGPIRESTSRADLDRLLGRNCVKDAAVHLGEGRCAKGARVFGGEANEIEVAWQDAARTRVALVRSQAQAGTWATQRGVRAGTTLSELERAAGAPVTFLGFGWDYGGSMRRVEGKGVMRLFVHLTERVSALSGDIELRSDLPKVAALRSRIRVRAMEQSWGNGEIPDSDCETNPAVRTQ
jgi:hypothetical protein